MGTTKAEQWAIALDARTLREAHNKLGALMPPPGAALKVQRDFHLASAKAYARVAEVDRDHHHEATYWATRERQKAEEITQRMKREAAKSG